MEGQDLLPDDSNFFATLTTALSKEELTWLYERRGWAVRKCSWFDFEVSCLWAELVLESDNPILLHGSVTDVVTNAQHILEPIRATNITYTAECYGEDDRLLEQFFWSGGVNA
jgi:hypothetical protein